MMRALTVLATTALLAGCAQLSAVMGQRDTQIVVEPANQEALLVSVPALRAQGYVIKTSQIGTVATWRTPDNASFSFDRGVLVSTRGLGDDLMGADASPSIAAVGGRAADWAPRINGYMNGEYQSYFMTFQCRKTSAQQDQINAGDRLVSATRITETCVNDERRIENQYWRNGNGMVVKSRQWVSPTIGYMETEAVTR